MDKNEDAIQLYQRLSGVGVDRSVIEHVIEEVCAARGESEALAERLEDEDRAQVFFKDARDVIVLVTGALEAPTHHVYRDMVAHAGIAEFEPVDEFSVELRHVLARNMAEAALEDLDVGPERAAVLANLQYGLRVLGDECPFHDEEGLPAAASF